MTKTLTAGSFAILLLAFQAREGFAGLETLTGVGADFWKEFSVVYAEVASVKDLGSARASVTLRVRASLTGFYDAAERPVVETQLSYNPFASAIPKPPKPNDRVVAVLYRRSEGRIFIAAAQLLFMPDYAGLVVVKGFDDPKVGDIIRRVQEVRGMKSRPGLWLELIKKEEKRKLEEIKNKEEQRKMTKQEQQKAGRQQESEAKR